MDLTNVTKPFEALKDIKYESARQIAAAEKRCSDVEVIHSLLTDDALTTS